MFFLSEDKSILKKLLSVCRLLLSKVILVGLVFELAGCGGRPIWKNHGDSCINISENPPLKRVINYTDNDLCERKLSPRKAPNPQTRPNNVKD
tara:strand:- start:282 stop:560 length:279 start_codon:yes stop_codon:yes gene_type:complete